MTTVLGVFARTPPLDDELVVALFEDQAPALLRAVRLMVDDPQDAEEIVQEAFAKLLTSRKRMRQLENAPAYLRSATFNLARDHLRRRGSARRKQHLLSAEEHAVSAETIVARQAQNNDVVAALRLLPERQRECLVLRYFMALSEAEIADTLAISKGSVKTHTSRGMAALQATLGAER